MSEGVSRSVCNRPASREEVGRKEGRKEVRKEGGIRSFISLYLFLRDK